MHRVRRVRQARLVLVDSRVTRVSPVNQETQELLGLQVLLGQPDPLDLREILDHRERLELSEPQVGKVQLEHLEILEVLGLPEPLDRLVSLDLLDRLVTKARRGILATLAVKVSKVKLELLDRKVQLEGKDLQDLRAQLDSREIVVRLVVKDSLALADFKGPLE